jgi:flavin reductase (DIM6/NTAB) family NADH-FMN oxidoreductase RutF
VDPKTFRDLLGSFATGVTVLTTVDATGRPAGMTVSAVSAVSLVPPLLLVCIDRDADCHDTLRAGSGFVLNVLAAGQERLSARFAAELPDRFQGVAHDRGPGGLPILEGTVAHIRCELDQLVTAGDHTIFIARVGGGETHDRKPLLHFRGAYRGMP